MIELPTTHLSLMVRIRDARDDEAWRRFVAAYGPVVFGFATRKGLQEADAADLTQDVLQAVARAAPGWTYDRQRGTFRGWLYTVARNKLRDFLAERRRRPGGEGDANDLLEGRPAPAEEEQTIWEQEYDRQLFVRAAETVRPEFTEATWRAFWQVAVEGRSRAAVAAELGMTLGAVYIAKSRVLKRLKEQTRRLQEEDAGGVSRGAP